MCSLFHWYWCQKQIHSSFRFVQITSSQNLTHTNKINVISFVFINLRTNPAAASKCKTSSFSSFLRRFVWTTTKKKNSSNRPKYSDAIYSNTLILYKNIENRSSGWIFFHVPSPTRMFFVLNFLCIASKESDTYINLIYVLILFHLGACCQIIMPWRSTNDIFFYSVEAYWNRKGFR